MKKEFYSSNTIMPKFSMTIISGVIAKELNYAYAFFREKKATFFKPSSIVNFLCDIRDFFKLRELWCELIRELLGQNFLCELLREREFSN